MAENLNVGIMVNSVNTGSSHSDVSNNGVIEKYCYDNDPSYCTTYGGLYDWDEAMGYTTTEGAQGICPQGWHAPSDGEWCVLSMLLDSTVNCALWGPQGNVAGGKLKETGYSHWEIPNTGATNESGFTALGSGSREADGSFGNNLGRVGAFWTSGAIGQMPYAFSVGYMTASRMLMPTSSSSGLSARCIKD